MASDPVVKDEHTAAVDHVHDIDPPSSGLAALEERQLTPLQAIRKRPLSSAWCFYAVLVCLLVSFESQAAGMILSVPGFRRDFGTEFNGDYVLDANWQSALYGGPVAASVVGTLCAGFVSEIIGRKLVIIFCILLSFAAIAVEFVATTNAVFFGGKFMNAWVAGVLLTVSITYVGEIVPLALRGIVTCLTALMMTIGPLTASIIIDQTGSLESRWSYRAVFCAQFGFAALVAFPAPFMPESPFWLVSTNKMDKVASSLKRLGYSDEVERQSRIAQIESIIEQSCAEVAGATYFDCFRRSNLRRTIISIMPLAIQALSGVIFIASYGTYYIQLAGFSTSDSFKLQIGQHALAMAGNICSWFLVDRVGRRPLTFWGTFIISVILMLIAGLATEGSERGILGSVVLIVIYNFFYNISIGATAYTLLCEVSTSRLRTKTISIGISVQYTIFCIWSFVIPYMFNPDKANLGAKTGFLFGGISVLCLVYLWFFQPETAGRSYEELDELFMKGVSVREFAKYKTDAEYRTDEAK